jgi:hypothetical protein
MSLATEQRAMTARACKHSTSNCAGRIATRLRPTCRQTWRVVAVGLAFVAVRFYRQHVREFTAPLPSTVEREAFVQSFGPTATCRRSYDVSTDSHTASERCPLISPRCGRALSTEQPVRQRPSKVLIAQRRGKCHGTFWILPPHTPRINSPL